LRHRFGGGERARLQRHDTSLDALFGITVDTTNLTHIMRAVMGIGGRLGLSQFGGEDRAVGRLRNVTKAVLRRDGL
jgi:hypothetical protein